MRESGSESERRKVRRRKRKWQMENRSARERVGAERGREREGWERNTAKGDLFKGVFSATEETHT